MREAGLVWDEDKSIYVKLAPLDEAIARAKTGDWMAGEWTDFEAELAFTAEQVPGKTQFLAMLGFYKMDEQFGEKLVYEFPVIARYLEGGRLIQSTPVVMVIAIGAIGQTVIGVFSRQLSDMLLAMSKLNRYRRLKLIEARKAKWLSQKELADLAGLKQPAIARLESMKAMPQTDSLFKILQPLGCTLAVVPKEQPRE